MEPVAEMTEAQLQLWSLQIDRLAAKTQSAGVRARFDALMYIDELKALHAIAQVKLVEFQATAAGDKRRVRLKAEMKGAFKELGVAINNPKPPGLEGKTRARGGSVTPPNQESE